MMSKTRDATSVLAYLTLLCGPRLAVAQENPSEYVSDSVVVVVPREGAVVELPDFGRVIFAAGSFEAPETVTVKATNTPSTPSWLYGWHPEGTTPYLGFDLRLLSKHRPARNYEIEIFLPSSYVEVIEAESPPKVYREFIGGLPREALTVYKEVPSELDLESGVISVLMMPKESESELRVILIVGCCKPDL